MVILIKHHYPWKRWQYSVGNYLKMILDLHNEKLLGGKRHNIKVENVYQSVFKKKKLVLSRTQFSDTDSMKGNHVQAQLLYSRKKKKIKKNLQTGQKAYTAVLSYLKLLRYLEYSLIWQRLKTISARFIICHRSAKLSRNHESE